MICIELTKKLLNDKNLTDEEVRKIRDDFRELAEIIFDRWLEEKKKNEERN